MSCISKRWNKLDVTGDPPTPLELLVLLCWMVGRCLTLDDLEEATCVSAETHGQFHLKFIEYGSIVLWNKFVIKTSKNEDSKYSSKLFQSAGFPGFIASVDGTHVLLEKLCWLGTKQAQRL